MFQKILNVISIVFFFLLQSSVFPNLNLGLVIPNFLVLIVCVYGFIFGEKPGALYGFFAGLLIDVFFGEMLGLNALILTIIGYLNGGFNGLFYDEDIRLPLFLIALSDASYGLLFYVSSFLIKGRLSFGYYLMNIILPEIFYTLLVALIIYPVVLWVNRLFSGYRLKKELEKTDVCRTERKPHKYPYKPCHYLLYSGYYSLRDPSLQML